MYNQNYEQLLRLPEVLNRVGLKKAATYNAIKAGTFPKPILLSKRAVAWQASAVQAWIVARVEAAKTQTATVGGA